MTKNQIEYAKLLEGKRSNRAQEALTQWRDTEQMKAKYVELGETSRHNQALEGIEGRKLGETSRHNRVTEGTEKSKVAESIRHNQQSESVERGKLDESVRHNTAVESETHRANVASEIHRTADLAERTVTNQQKIAETARHNRIMELKDYSTRVSLNPSNSINSGGSNSAPGNYEGNGPSTTGPSGASKVELDPEQFARKGYEDPELLSRGFGVDSKGSYRSEIWTNGRGGRNTVTYYDNNNKRGGGFKK